MLTPEDIERISDRVVIKLQHAALAAPVPPVIPCKLTVEQFAFLVQRSPYRVRQVRRQNREFKKHCEGENPIMIHPVALKFFGVDPALAAARLQQFRTPSAA